VAAPVQSPGDRPVWRWDSAPDCFLWRALEPGSSRVRRRPRDLRRRVRFAEGAGGCGPRPVQDPFVSVGLKVKWSRQAHDSAEDEAF